MPRIGAAALTRAAPQVMPVLHAVPRALRAFFWLWRATIIGTYQNGVLGTAKGAAYSALLAFLPALATVAAILVHARAEFVVEAISDFLARVLPPGTEDLVFYYFTATGRRPALLPVGAVFVAIWAASGVVVSLMQGFRATYRTPTNRSFLRERAVAILLVISAIVPVLGASVLIVVGARVERSVVRGLGLLAPGTELTGWVAFAGALTRYLIAFAAIAFGATILYFFGPNRPQRWRRVWPGAVLATLMWLGATVGFGWYVRNIAQYNVLYGGIATAILLLIWMYLLAVIALIGCEFNAAYEKMKGRLAI